MKSTINSIAALEKLWKIFDSEQSFLRIFLFYSFVTTIFYLAIPLSAQILLNIVSTGVLIQPLIIFAFGILIAFLILAGMRIAQYYTIEIIQRRFLYKIADNIAQKIYYSPINRFTNIYAPELVNRFFEIMNIQKNSAYLLLEIPSAFLQIFAGLILIAIYSNVLLVFDLIFIFILFFIYFAGRGAVFSSYAESTSKYKIAFWLEDISRCLINFKFHGSPSYLFDTNRRLIDQYLQDRSLHFKILIRQFSTNVLVQAFASAGVLGIGGFLVMQGALSLGELIASEIVIVMIIAALDKIAQKFENWYDLLTSTLKISSLIELEEEQNGTKTLPSNLNQGLSLRCENLAFAYDSHPSKFVLENFHLSIKASAKVSLVGISGSGKTTLAFLLSKILPSSQGKIYINDICINEIQTESLRKSIAFVGNFGEIFFASLRDNICLGREACTDEALKEVIDLVELQRDIDQFTNGLDTILLSEGRNISLGQRQRILLARALILKPQLLILDEAFSGMDEAIKLRIMDKIFDSQKSWTILNISHDPEVVIKTHQIFLLEKGSIIESGSISELAADSKILELFPKLK